MFYAVVLYTYYHAILDHSGITFKAQWWQPWQPDAIFHDNHHQYTHVNFGFNIYLWDVVGEFDISCLDFSLRLMSYHLRNYKLMSIHAISGTVLYVYSYVM